MLTQKLDCASWRAVFGENIQRVSKTREIYCGRNFFRGQKRVYSGTVIAARRNDPRFSRLLYSRRWIYSTAPRISTDTENMA